MTGSHVLTIGLHPKVLDYNRFPGLDEAALLARIDAVDGSLRDAGFEATSCRVSASPDEAEAEVRQLLAEQSFDVAMIGAAVRAIPEHTLLFERIVNTLIQANPRIRLCFNTSPETTVDALRRGTTRLAG
ncbi:hypothetical protein [Nocardia jiangxiensis]|uniref:hypothetical protein n=1 Tax=Nocardia jiangxiensis TaxID=282685 RepID=UPI000311CED8|nr:hypothetical protein [Nocardia jiangxiensis]